MKCTLTIFVFLCFFCNSYAQTFSPANLKILKEKEDSLQEYARYMITDSLSEDRMISDSVFTRTLVRALQVRNSFYYPFHSVQGVSWLYAPDSSFRIITWNLQFDEYYARQKGAIQMRTTNGSLRLFPLRDVSEFTANAVDSMRTPANWIGAVYYNMIKTEHNGRNFYTLFGIDFHSIRSTKKWIEVLHFNAKGEPLFGGPMFVYTSDSLKRKSPHRVELEYKKNARVLANYIPDLGLILTDHLISETDEPENSWTFIPDGDNQAFKWENGKWMHVDKAFDFKVDMQGVDPHLGNPPVGDPLLDKKGNINQKKLEEQSEKNRKKKEGGEGPM